MTSVIFRTIVNSNEIQYINELYDYSSEIRASKCITHHEYCNDLPKNIKPHVLPIKYGTIVDCICDKNPNSAIYNIDNMNELYIASIGANGSDRVFETPHIDGPFFWLPFCKVYRTIVALQGNVSVHTQFPNENPSSYVLNTYDFIAFDYTRDVHYIWKNEDVCDANPRVLLKLHYLVTPKFVPNMVAKVYMNAHSKYNEFMRYLFLRSQSGDGILSRLINFGTMVYCNAFVNCVRLRNFIFTRR